MWSHRRTLKLGMAAGTLGLLLLAPAGLPIPPWLLLAGLLVPLGVYLVGGMIEEDATDPERARLGDRTRRFGAGLYLVVAAALGARAMWLAPPWGMTGVVFAFLGVLPALGALRRRNGVEAP